MSRALGTSPIFENQQYPCWREALFWFVLSIGPLPVEVYFPELPRDIGHGSGFIRLLDGELNEPERSMGTFRTPFGRRKAPVDSGNRPTADSRRAVRHQ
jgi:hypothetical protein